MNDGIIWAPTGGTYKKGASAQGLGRSAALASLDMARDLGPICMLHGMPGICLGMQAVELVRFRNKVTRVGSGIHVCVGGHGEMVGVPTCMSKKRGDEERLWEKGGNGDDNPSQLLVALDSAHRRPVDQPV